MKNLFKLLRLTFVGATVCLATVSGVKSAEPDYFVGPAVNRIDGMVWDPYRHPVSGVYVELQNEIYSTISRLRTDSSGRFSFFVANQGNYYIKVLASGTSYQDTIEPVELVNVTRFSSDNVYRDIYLKFDKRKISVGISGVTEAVFVQEIPDEARRLYKNGVKSLGNNDDDGLSQIEQALQIFPNYFDALNTLGCEYVRRQEYQKSFPYLIKSIDINQRSFSSYYALAYAAYKLNHRAEATEAVKAAVTLQPKSLNAQLLYGTLLRLSGSYEQAERTLLQAMGLSKDFPVAEIHWQLALLYHKINRNKEAADQLDKYLKIEPDVSNKKEIKELIAKLRKETK